MEEAWAGHSLLAFDGRVLEVFGFPGSQSVRFHARNMELDIGEPDRKGTRLVTLKAAVRGAGGIALSVDEADWPHVGPLLDRVLAAMPG